MESASEVPCKVLILSARFFADSREKLEKTAFKSPRTKFPSDMQDFTKRSKNVHESGFIGLPYDVRLLICHGTMEYQRFIKTKLVLTQKTWIEFRMGGQDWNLYNVDTQLSPSEYRSGHTKEFIITRYQIT